MKGDLWHQAAFLVKWVNLNGIEYRCKFDIILTVDSVFTAFNASIYICSYCSKSEMSTFIFFKLVLPAEFKTFSNSSFCKRNQF